MHRKASMFLLAAAAALAAVPASAVEAAASQKAVQTVAANRRFEYRRENLWGRRLGLGQRPPLPPRLDRPARAAHGHEEAQPGTASPGLQGLSMPKLIDDWRQAWRFLSVQAAAALAVLSMIQADVLPFVQPLVPAKDWPWVSLGFAAVIGFFRILAQGLPSNQVPSK